MSSATRTLTRSLLVFGLWGLLACGEPVQSDPPPTVPADFDLSSPEMLASLGVPAPTIDWERPIDRLRYAGDGAPPSAEEVGLVSRVIDDIPTALLAKLDVRYVIRATDATVARPSHPQAVAFAVGPDIYLLDRVFVLSQGGSTRFDLARALGHELAHVAQFQTMTDEYIAIALSGRLTQINPIDGSQLVAEFAEATGWVNGSDDDGIEAWSLPPGVSASSEYGATNPGEDMAEAVALVITGSADLVPDDRVRWVEQWLGAPADVLSIGQPWIPAGAITLISEDPLYDVEAVSGLAGSLRHTEPLYLGLGTDSPLMADLVELVTTRLRSRVMTGSLERIDDDRVPRFGGRFARPDGTYWWVELWDFPHRAAGVSGPSDPVLVYVAIW